MDISILEPAEVADAGVGDPLVPLDEGVHREPLRRRLVDDVEASPLDAPAGAGAGTAVAVLGVVQGVQVKIAVPRHPPFGPDEVADGGLHHDRPGVCLPRPAEEAGDSQPVGEQPLVWHDPAVLIMSRWHSKVCWIYRKI